MATVRVGCVLLANVLAQRLTVPAFAVLPAVLIAMRAYWSAPFGLAGTSSHAAYRCSTMRANDSRDRRWLVLAGTPAGVAFVFKQNVGALRYWVHDLSLRSIVTTDGTQAHLSMVLREQLRHLQQAEPRADRWHHRQAICPNGRRKRRWSDPTRQGPLCRH